MASLPFRFLIGERSEALAGLIAEHGLMSAAYIMAFSHHCQGHVGRTDG